MSYYGLEGVLRVTVNSRGAKLRAGEAVFNPRGAVHHHEKPHAGTAKILAVITPGTIGRNYFDAVSVPCKPDPARLSEIMERHGLIPA
ncbi:cupin domain-containing protein [Paracoccus ravus]|uniref:cupin domain-containing protein n=1 Tax=Paracoccus ravus TaxID=2447760 RepID=UPI00246863EE|nr:cupin domain-containing protein [Paracoccus ravus]